MDLISREEVRDLMYHEQSPLTERMLDDIYPVDAAPIIHARWERAEDDYCYWHRCSNCKEKAPKNEWGQDMFSAFCPSCGARMDLPEEEDAR